GKGQRSAPRYLPAYGFDELVPAFAASIQPGHLIVAGKNFGCGSVREVAVTALAGAGIRAVLARSFSRTYYRNAVNNGLLPVVCDTRGIREGDSLALADAAIRNQTTGETIATEPLPPVMLEIIQAGGLVGYMVR